MGFTRAQLEAFRDHTVDDLLPDPLKLLIVGINPGLWTAATNTHFARPGNRFYPALARAGIIDHPFDTRNGISDADRAQLLAAGIGITNLCPRATARADEVSETELRTGSERVRSLIRERRPAVVAVAGITAYRTAFGVRGARLGRQDDELDGAVLFVVPNPSGLNAHARLDDLTDAFAEAARAAGIPPSASPRRNRTEDVL
jgi:TDG/mug DNA glycosylase family protein